VKILEDGKGDDWPSKINIEDLAMRNDAPLLEVGHFDECLVKYWDNLLVKVCGITYWNPCKRHYGNISTHEEPKGSKSTLNKGPYVDPTAAEAFLVWTFENAYDKWHWPTKEKALLIQLAAKKTTQAEIDKQRLTDNETPYTIANGGQQQWGGTTPKGKERFLELVEMITKNRAENKAAVKVVEDRVLDKVRKDKGRDEIDAKRTGKKTPKKKVVHVEPDEVVDERDFNTW